MNKETGEKTEGVSEIAEQPVPEDRTTCPFCGGVESLRRGTAGDSLRCDDCGVAVYFHDHRFYSLAHVRVWGTLKRAIRGHEREAERLSDLLDDLRCGRKEPAVVLRESEL
jgi:hypothetical protein